ncbi:MAG: hypothetical protein V3S29_02355 [bacterium]
MRSDLATDFRARLPRLSQWAPPALAMPAVLLALLLAGAGCADKAGPEKPKGKTVLTTQSGETGIQVTEVDEDGTQVIRITTTFRGKKSVISLAVDQPVYEIDIPLSIGQVQPQVAGGGGAPGAGGGGQGNFQDLLIAQYLEKAQSGMLEGNYNEALKQVNLVLMVRPDHIKAHEMKGSVYYAMGSYQLANEEWEQVLALDPSNREVRDFMDFNQRRQGAPRPDLPEALQSGDASPAGLSRTPATQPAAAPLGGASGTLQPAEPISSGASPQGPGGGGSP